jgi:hypothetical protein
MGGIPKKYLPSTTSSKTLTRYFDNYLKRPPLPQKLVFPRSVYIKIDAQYYSDDNCIVLVKTGKEIIYWKDINTENLRNYIYVFIDISDLGYKILGVTSDWHGSLVGSIKYIFPLIPHQRCLVHLQRRCESLLTKNPQTQAGLELLDIVKFLNKITSKYEANIWLLWLDSWKGRYEDLIKERTYGDNTWWYTHKNLRATFRSIYTCRDHLFLYLDNDQLEKDTNGLESEFSHLKQKVRMHRGLKSDRRTSMIYWYVFLKNQERI